MARRIKIVQIKTSTTAQSGVRVVETGFTLPPETTTKPEKKIGSNSFHNITHQAMKHNDL